jgi:hypothetical protein
MATDAAPAVILFPPRLPSAKLAQPRGRRHTFGAERRLARGGLTGAAMSANFDPPAHIEEPMANTTNRTSVADLNKANAG